MSRDYDEYLDMHIRNVQKSYDWIKENIPDVLTYSEGNLERNIKNHDESKFSVEEYYAYDKHFFTELPQDPVEFKMAWLHHIHNNPHHWDYWILHDDGEVEALPMPYDYIVEMICDWWSFSWAKDEPTEVFYWYTWQKDKMILEDSTRKNIEFILSRIAEVLEERGYQIDRNTVNCLPYRED